MKQIVSVVVFLGLLIQGCQKKQQLPHYTINPRLMSAWGFKTGTYWIYQDSLSGEVDSFVVTGAQLRNSQGGNEVVDIYNIGILIYTPKFAIYNIQIDLADSILGLYFFNFINKMEQDRGYDICYYPLNKPQIIYVQGDTININNNIGDFTINGKIYNDISQIHHFSLNDFGNINFGGIMKHSDWFYICNNIGFVKIIFNHPDDSVYRNWELLRYHVEK